jgi:hypothetical protein
MARTFYSLFRAADTGYPPDSPGHLYPAVFVNHYALFKVQLVTERTMKIMVAGSLAVAAFCAATVVAVYLKVRPQPVVPTDATAKSFSMQEIDPDLNASPPNSSSELGQLRNEVAELRSKLGFLTTHLDRISTSREMLEPPVASSSANSERLQDPTLARREREEEADAHRARVLNPVIEEFASEGTDEPWASEIDETITGAFLSDERLAVGNLVSVDCRTTLCGISASIPSGLTDDERFEFDNTLLIELSKAGLASGYAKGERQADGSLNMTLYVRRQQR